MPSNKRDYFQLFMMDMELTFFKRNHINYAKCGLSFLSAEIIT